MKRVTEPKSVRCAVALLVIGVIFAACDSPLHFPKNMSPAQPLRDTGIRMVVIGDGLPKVQFSYRQADLDMAPAVLTVTNTSTETTGPLTVSLSWPEIQIRQTEVLFEVAGGAIGAPVPGGSAEFEVKATGLGLRVGDYPVTVTVSDAAGQYFSQRQMTFKVDYNAVIDLAESNPSTATEEAAYVWNGSPYNFYAIMPNKAVKVTGSTTTRRIEIPEHSAMTYVYLDGATIDLQSTEGNPFKVNGNANVTLTMKENTTNILKTRTDTGTTKAALNVAQGATLTIEGPGTLQAINPHTNSSGAGIGGDNTATKAGTIIINGGTVTAQGGGSSGGAGAGIGSGASGIGWEGITINGGTVIARTKNGGAGIGGGDVTPAVSVCGDIVINGGDVTATAENGAGIGRGYWYSFPLNIIIRGGTVTASTTVATGGRGIGWGKNSTDSVNITIAGGTITASSVTAGSAISNVSPTLPAAYTWSDSNNVNGSPLFTSSTAFPGTPYTYNASRKWVQIIAPDAPVP